MRNKIAYKKSVYKDLKRLPKQVAIKIIDIINIELYKEPTPGKKLKGHFKDIYSFRAGNYRVLYTVLREGVLVLGVNHRKEVYRR